MTQIPSYPAYKVLRRSRSDRMLGGVCGGLARYVGIDPVAARVLYVIATFLTGGVLLIAYPILWIVIPDEYAHPQQPTWPAQPSQPTQPTQPMQATPPTAGPVG